MIVGLGMWGIMKVVEVSPKDFLNPMNRRGFPKNLLNPMNRSILI
jgi:hypothetical protein